MRTATVFARAFGLVDAVVECIDFDDQAEAIVVGVRVAARARGRCGRCGHRSPGYDQGAGRRRWRATDLGTTRVFIEADAPRVSCPTHGPTVASVPWARHDAGHTLDFDSQAAWLAVHVSKSAVVELLRIAWQTVGAIVERVSAEIDLRIDRLAGLRRIGIDEISYKRNHHYLTVVVDHDTGRLVWAAPGRDDATLHRFFEALGPERSAELTHVSADGAAWIKRVVRARCPNAVIAMDPFHVVAWATDALDRVRRQVQNDARGGRANVPGSLQRVAYPRRSSTLRRARFALWKNPENLSATQQAQLEWIATSHPDVWHAYTLKEGLRLAFSVGGEAGKEALDSWLLLADQSSLPPFIDVARRVRKLRAEIDTALDTGLSNGLIESTNTKIRLMTRVAFGFHGPQPLIALAMLALGGHRPRLPGR